LSDDIFAGGNDPTPPTPNTNNYVDQLVGEGKKYSSIDELAKSKLHGDEFIEQLKGELAEVRSQLATQDRLQEVLDRLDSRNNSNDDGYRAPDEGTPNNHSGQPAISKKDIETLIEQTVTQKEIDRTARQNREEAVRKLKELLGDDYTRRLEERREELGLDKSTLNDLAARSPQAFIELVAPKGTTAERPFTPPPSGQRSEALDLNKNNAAPGTPEYYRNLKKANPALYRSPEVQMKLHKDVIKAATEGKDFDLSGL
jgi:hypothetical protein